MNFKLDFFENETNFILHFWFGFRAQNNRLFIFFSKVRLAELTNFYIYNYRWKQSHKWNNFITFLRKIISPSIRKHFVYFKLVQSDFTDEKWNMAEGVEQISLSTAIKRKLLVISRVSVWVEKENKIREENLNFNLSECNRQLLLLCIDWKLSLNS